MCVREKVWGMHAHGLMSACVNACVCLCAHMCAWTRCCWVESVSRGKEKDKCSLKIAPGQLVYTVYQQSVPGAKGGGQRMDVRESERNVEKIG